MTGKEVLPNMSYPLSHSTWSANQFSGVKIETSIIIALTLTLAALCFTPYTVSAANKTTISTHKNIIVLTKVNQLTLSSSGIATWTNVANAKNYQVQLYRNGSIQGAAKTVTSGKTGCNFLSEIRAVVKEIIPWEEWLIMLKKIIGIAIGIVGILTIIFIIDMFCLRFPEYVLFKNGIEKSNIILTCNGDTDFKIYLYKKKVNNQNRIGLINLFKTKPQSKKWKIYYHEKQPLLKDDIIFMTHYSTAVQGKPEVVTVIGGYTSTDNVI